MKKIIVYILILLIVINILPIYNAQLIEKSNIKIKPSLSPGDHFRFIITNGRIRTYQVHIPPSYDNLNPFPLVLVLHGHKSCANHFKYVTDFNSTADKEGFIVVYPNGRTSPYVPISDLIMFIKYFEYGYWPRIWNYCDLINNVDDVLFIRSLIKQLQNNLNINTSRIYITGSSNGGQMTFRLGSELSDIVAAIGPVSTTIGGRLTKDSPFYIIPDPEYPISVIYLHGTNDAVFPYEGGGEREYVSVNDSVAFWVEHNNCDPIPRVNISESGKIITRTYTNGSDNTEVTLYIIVDGIHEWFGGNDRSPCEISATEVIWRFFKQHPK